MDQPTSAALKRRNRSAQPFDHNAPANAWAPDHRGEYVLTPALLRYLQSDGILHVRRTRPDIVVIWDCTEE